MITEDKYKEAIARLANDQQRVLLDCGKFELWCVLSAIDLAMRHPNYTGPSREYVEAFREQLVGVVCANDRDLQLCAAMGKDKRFDERKA